MHMRLLCMCNEALLHAESFCEVMQLMETDLHEVIQSSTELTADHVHLIGYQMVRGLKCRGRGVHR